jgi:hypothetical protein
LSLDDLVPDRGELALTIEFDPDTQHALVEACVPLPADTTQDNITAAYISLCDSASSNFDSVFPSELSCLDSDSDSKMGSGSYVSFSNVKLPLAIFAGKKYKPVVLKIRPIETKLPEPVQNYL